MLFAGAMRLWGALYCATARAIALTDSSALSAHLAANRARRLRALTHARVDAGGDPYPSLYTHGMPPRVRQRTPSSARALSAALRCAIPAYSGAPKRSPSQQRLPRGGHLTPPAFPKLTQN